MRNNLGIMRGCDLCARVIGSCGTYLTPRCVITIGERLAVCRSEDRCQIPTHGRFVPLPSLIAGTVSVIHKVPIVGGSMLLKVGTATQQRFNT